MKKRTKQVEKMVEVANKVLKEQRIIDEYYSDMFQVMQYLLLKTDTYAGYNWFFEEEYTDVVGKTTRIQKLVGSSNHIDIRNKNGYVQFY